MIKRLLFWGIALLILFTSCKTMKTKGTSITHLSSNKVAGKHNEAKFSKNTVQAKIKTHYQDAKQSYNLTIKLRIKKDEVIWMSGSFLGFPIAKVKITPTRVQYYEKIKKTYFDGDFSIISKALGVELNFQQLQNLLFGQSLLDLDSKHKSTVKDQSYFLTPKRQADLFDIFYWINPIHYKLDKQKLSTEKTNQSLDVEYKTYQKVFDEYFPSTIVITANDSKQVSRIKMEFRNIEFDKEMHFPFQIPSHYKEISIDRLK